MNTQYEFSDEMVPQKGAKSSSKNKFNGEAQGACAAEAVE